MSQKTIVYIKCDRCGKQFEEQPLEELHFFKPTYVYTRALMNIRKKDRKIVREHIPYDLCKECSESLTEWFIKGIQEGN